MFRVVRQIFCPSIVEEFFVINLSVVGGGGGLILFFFSDTSRCHQESYMCRLGGSSKKKTPSFSWESNGRSPGNKALLRDY